jgi:hypothetical protein
MICMTADPIDALHDHLVAICHAWQIYAAPPDKQLQNVIVNLPDALCDAYRTAKQVDLLRGGDLIAEPRNSPAGSEPAELPWLRLFDYFLD